MRINFFEECIADPEIDLANAALITWPATIYIAAHSLAEFHERKKILVSYNSTNTELEAAYWPILPNSYWISPFADPAELETLRKELLEYSGKKLEVLLDLELPILKPSQFKRNMLHFTSNRRRIRQLLALKKETILFSTAEYWYAIGWASFLSRIAGTSYINRITKHRRLIMYYSSIIKDNGVVQYTHAMNYMKVALGKEAARKRGVQAALGTTSIGILGNEVGMTNAELEHDLNLLQSFEFKEATIFRLAGIKPYMETLKKYI
jgi:hypothetical protein